MTHSSSSPTSSTLETGTVLAVSQVYPPDPASVGQHLADAANELARRGHHVVVYTANRGYDDPSMRFPSRELVNGVHIRRVSLSSFGKNSILVRLLGGLLFLAQAIIRGAFVHDVQTVVVSTTPPMAGIAGVILATIHRARLVYWVMDMNPDQAVALGLFARTNLLVRFYEALNRIVLRRADAVVAMDRLMKQRLLEKGEGDGRIVVLPPWPHEEPTRPVLHEENTFRQAHGLEGKFVVMYSGNHSPANPLRTVIEAALALRDDPRIVFAFVGGGIGKREIDAVRSPNILSLPYQPITTLRESLAAADIHIVTMGNAMAGIIHPCKVYGALAASRPILFVGPSESHVGDLLANADIGWQANHGDVDAVVAIVRLAAALHRSEWTRRGDAGRKLIEGRLSKRYLLGRFCDVVEGRNGAAA